MAEKVRANPSAVDTNIDWGQPGYTKWMIAFVVWWRYVGWTAVLYLSAMQTIPKDLFEAATMDGAKPWQQFRHVCLPLLLGLLFVAAYQILLLERVLRVRRVPGRAHVAQVALAGGHGRDLRHAVTPQGAHEVEDVIAFPALGDHCGGVPRVAPRALAGEVVSLSLSTLGVVPEIGRATDLPALVFFLARSPIAQW